ncbi:MAG: penicillin-binding protein activator [Kofleriaceae bacterium]
MAAVAVDGAAALRAALAAGAPGPIVAAAVTAPPADVAAAAAAIARAIDAASPTELAAAAAGMATDRAPAGAIATRLALVAAHTGDAAGLARWRAVATAAPDGDPARLAALPTPPVIAPDTVAVLLPLSGPFAAVGRELAAAIELAPLDGARRLVLDSGGDPVLAAAAVDQAAAAGAIAILGPVGVREAEGAARRASRLGIPIALLAPADGADPAAGVFRLVDSPESEARAAARFAAELGVARVAVLAPRDEVGAAAADAFATTASGLGLAVTARGDFDPTGGALEDDVKRFLGLDPATNPRLAAHLRRTGRRGWQTFSPDVAFALLYIPDRYDRAALVASFLPYLGVEVHSDDFVDLDALTRKHGGRTPQVVQLLGSSGWNHPSLATRGGDAVEGALMLEPCPLGQGDLASDAFAEAFRARTRRDPSPAAAASHDAWRLVAAARTRAARASQPRLAFVAARAATTVDDGVCAPTGVGADGQLTRTPAVLKVDLGQLVVEPY